MNSRDIRFKAWLPEFETMIDEDFTGNSQLDEGDVVFYCGPSGISVCIMGIVDELIDGEHHQDYKLQLYEDAKILLYTGLTDKNGVEIYEGDIVTVGNSSEYAVVIYCQDDCAFKVDANMWISLIADCPHLVVHGNIHENPEVMEQK